MFPSLLPDSFSFFCLQQKPESVARQPPLLPSISTRYRGRARTAASPSFLARSLRALSSRRAGLKATDDFFFFLMGGREVHGCARTHSDTRAERDARVTAGRKEVEEKEEEEGGV